MKRMLLLRSLKTSLKVLALALELQLQALQLVFLASLLDLFIKLETKELLVSSKDPTKA